MTPEQLKASILLYAIQGKLVEQRAEEGTAEELYQQIQEEKQRLIKEKKIKKGKPLPEITEDEIPFDIPESWKWVRFANLSAVLNGDRGKNYPAKSTLSHTGIPFISALNLDGKTVIEDDKLLRMTEEQYNKLRNGKLQKDDIVVCIRGSLGKHGRYPFDKGAIASSLVIVRPIFVDNIFAEYVMRYLDSPLFFNEIKKYDNGTAQPNLAAKSFEQFLFPLPPLAEQKRIVAKIEELLPLVDRYAVAYEKLEKFNAKFPEDMKKSILQYSIQGKLVEQRHEEGTGEELYQQIQAEKQRLIKEKKIKKEKPLAEITDDEIPFDIPESWKWVRLQNITTVLGDGIHGTPQYTINGGYYFINGNNLTEGRIEIKSDTKQVDAFEYEKHKKPLDTNTILISINGTIGNYAFYEGEPIILGKSACYFSLLNDVSKEYICMLIKSKVFFDYAKREATQTTIKNVSLKSMRMLPVPLPPLAEQKRIVAKLEEILPLCERLK